MFVELVDHLRCPNPHADICLVAAAATTVGRDIVDGLLGCPICRAEYPIRNGIAHFAEREQPGGGGAGSQEEAMRLAAFLNLAEPLGFAALCGSWGRHASLLQSLTDVHLVLVDPPRDAAIGNGTSGLVAGDVLPLSQESLRAVALDFGASRSLIASAIRAVRPRGRIIAPASIAVPAGVTELARDNHIWVGEREAAPPELVSLGRG